MPVEVLHKDDIFSVEITLTTKAINHIQGESFVGAFVRDPLEGVADEDSGIQIDSDGLDQIDPVEDVPVPEPPLTCSSGPDPAAGELQFLVAAIQEPELSESAEVFVQRVGGTTGEVGVHFDTQDGSALAGTDYQAVSTEVRFADGESGTRRILVPLVADAIPEDAESLSLVPFPAWRMRQTRFTDPCDLDDTR